MSQAAKSMNDAIRAALYAAATATSNPSPLASSLTVPPAPATPASASASDPAASTAASVKDRAKAAAAPYIPSPTAPMVPTATATTVKPTMPTTAVAQTKASTIATAKPSTASKTTATTSPKPKSNAPTSSSTPPAKEMLNANRAANLTLNSDLSPAPHKENGGKSGNATTTPSTSKASKSNLDDIENRLVQLEQQHKLQSIEIQSLKNEIFGKNKNNGDSSDDYAGTFFQEPPIANSKKSPSGGGRTKTPSRPPSAKKTNYSVFTGGLGESGTSITPTSAGRSKRTSTAANTAATDYIYNSVAAASTTSAKSSSSKKRKKSISSPTMTSNKKFKTPPSKAKAKKSTPKKSTSKKTTPKSKPRTPRSPALKLPLYETAETCLPPGWKFEKVKRNNDPKHSDRYWYTPHSNYKIRSKVQVKKFLDAYVSDEFKDLKDGSAQKEQAVWNQVFSKGKTTSR